MSDPHASVKLEVDDGVAVLTLARPEKRNALDTHTVQLISRALGAWAVDDAVRAVVLTGMGKAFCAGADLSEFRHLAPGEEAQLAAARTHLMDELVRQVSQFPKPLIAAVDGAAVGLGALLALAADVTLLGEGAKLSFPEVAIGRVPSLIAAPLVRMVGRRLAFALLVEGVVLDAEGAVAQGLANRVVPSTQALPVAREAARNMARLEPVVVCATKALIDECAPVCQQ